MPLAHGKRNAASCLDGYTTDGSTQCVNRIPPAVVDSEEKRGPGSGTMKGGLEGTEEELELTRRSRGSDSSQITKPSSLLSATWRLSLTVHYLPLNKIAVSIDKREAVVYAKFKVSSRVAIGEAGTGKSTGFQDISMDPGSGTARNALLWATVLRRLGYPMPQRCLIMTTLNKRGKLGVSYDLQLMEQLSMLKLYPTYNVPGEPALGVEVEFVLHSKRLSENSNVNVRMKWCRNISNSARIMIPPDVGECFLDMIITGRAHHEREMLNRRVDRPLSKGATGECTAQARGKVDQSEFGGGYICNRSWKNCERRISYLKEKEITVLYPSAEQTGVTRQQATEKLECFWLRGDHDREIGGAKVEDVRALRRRNNYAGMTRRGTYLKLLGFDSLKYCRKRGVNGHRTRQADGGDPDCGRMRKQEVIKNGGLCLEAETREEDGEGETRDGKEIVIIPKDSRSESARILQLECGKKNQRAMLRDSGEKIK
ncbi:hypothetical protein B0H13DRAFT_1889274 [Mycena leptocephala]|nr:hypothetical protein B0H13DRAFT_1889274 [Mycena leptocephala]